MRTAYRALPAAAVAAALLWTVPADAVDECVDRGVEHACVALLEGDRYACASTRVDPSKNMTDDTSGGYVCLADIGSGPEVFSCFYAGRRHFLCTR